MILTTEEVLSLAAGELLLLRREPLIRLRHAPPRPVRNRKPKPMKFAYAPERRVLSQTSELLGWVDQVLTPMPPAPSSEEVGQPSGTPQG